MALEVFPKSQKRCRPLTEDVGRVVIRWPPPGGRGNISARMLFHVSSYKRLHLLCAKAGKRLFRLSRFELAVIEEIPLTKISISVLFRIKAVYLEMEISYNVCVI